MNLTRSMALLLFILATEMPHGGMNMSGYGKHVSMYGLEDYPVARQVMVKLD